MPCQSCQLMWAFMRQSSSYRSPVLKKGNTCGCQPVTTVRQPFSCQVPSSQRVRSMKSVSFGMLKAEKAWVLQTPQTLCEEDSLVSDAALVTLVADAAGFTVSRNPVATGNRFRARLSRALDIFCRAGRRQAPVVGVHAAIQFVSITSTEERADLSVGRALATLVTLVADAAGFTASRNLVATRNHVACCSSEQEWAEHWTTFAVPEEYGRIQAPVLAQRLARPANWCGCSFSNPVRIDHQYWRKGTHAGVSQWPLWDNHSLAKFHPRKGSDQWRVSPSECWKLRLVELGRHLRLVWRRFLGFWCCCVTVSRNPVATGNHVACSASGQEWAEHWTSFVVPEEYKHLC